MLRRLRLSCGIQEPASIFWRSLIWSWHITTGWTIWRIGYMYSKWDGPFHGRDLVWNAKILVSTIDNIQKSVFSCKKLQGMSKRPDRIPKTFEGFFDQARKIELTKPKEIYVYISKDHSWTKKRFEWLSISDSVIHHTQEVPSRLPMLREDQLNRACAMKVQIQHSYCLNFCPDVADCPIMSEMGVQHDRVKSQYDIHTVCMKE